MQNSNSARLATFALLCAVLTLAIIVMAPMGFRLKWWSWSNSLIVLRVAVFVAALAVALSAFGIFRAWSRGQRSGLARSFVALVIMIPTLVTPLYWNYLKSELPPIQDISTDLKTPPEFWDSPTSNIYAGESVAVQQRAAYPDIQPLHLSRPMNRVFDQVVALVEERGWKLVAAVRDEGRIEATVTTFWYGFKDDVVFRLTQQDAQVRVDMRSTSRFGVGGDGGSNAGRIRDLLAELDLQPAD